MLYIDVFYKYNLKKQDNILEDTLSNFANEKIISVLKGKYNLNEYDSILQISDFFNYVDTVKTIENFIISDTFSKNLLENTDNKFVLLTYIYGYYTYGVNPKSKYFRGDNLYRNYVNFPDITMYSVIIDTYSKKILFYDKMHSTADPRDINIVERMILKLIKGIYY